MSFIACIADLKVVPLAAALVVVATSTPSRFHDSGLVVIYEVATSDGCV